MRPIETVLLVDDESDIRRIGEISLARVGGWKVFAASGAEEALLLAGRERPDVILLDVMMPGTDGPAALERLREREETAGIPVIFMTAKVQRDDLERYRRLGAAGVIRKPFDPVALPAEVAALYSRATHAGAV